MPPTRSTPRARSKTAASSSSRNASPGTYHDVIVISSDEDEAMSSTGIALREARQEIRALKKKLAKEASEKNHVDATASSSNATKQDEERRRLESRLQRADTDLKKWKSKFSARDEEVTRLKNRIKAAEKDLDDLKVKNKKMREDTQKSVGRDNHSALADLQDYTTCDICSHRLWQPFLLPCGHTYCQTCLVEWFKLAVAVGARSRCPSCSALVNSAPVQNFALKSIVEAICHTTNPRGGSPPPPNLKKISWGPYIR